MSKLNISEKERVILLQTLKKSSGKDIDRIRVILSLDDGFSFDNIAKERLQSAFHDREIIVINCKALLSGHGSLHCITMQYPENFIR